MGSDSPSTLGALCRGGLNCHGDVNRSGIRVGVSGNRALSQLPLLHGKKEGILLSWWGYTESEHVNFFDQQSETERGLERSCRINIQGS